jgi:hypothetical protein
MAAAATASLGLAPLSWNHLFGKIKWAISVGAEWPQLIILICYHAAPWVWFRNETYQT